MDDRSLGRSPAAAWPRPREAGPAAAGAQCADGPGRMGSAAGRSDQPGKIPRQPEAADRRRSILCRADTGHSGCPRSDRPPDLHLRQRRLRPAHRRPAQAALAGNQGARSRRPARLPCRRPGSLEITVLLEQQAPAFDPWLPSGKFRNRSARAGKPLADLEPHQADNHRSRQGLYRRHEHRPRIPLRVA